MEEFDLLYKKAKKRKWNLQAKQKKEREKGSFDCMNDSIIYRDKVYNKLIKKLDALIQVIDVSRK